MAWAKWYPLTLSGISKEATLIWCIFAGWLVSGVILWFFTKKFRHWHIILLSAVFAFLVFSRSERAYFLFPFFWVYYIAWVIIFLTTGVLRVKKKERRYEILRHLVAFACVLGVGIYFKATEPMRLYQYWQSPSLVMHFSFCFIALLFSLFLVSEVSGEGGTTFAGLKGFHNRVRLMVIGVLGGFLLPLIIGPVITPRVHYQPKVSRIKADMRSLATGLECYFIDHGSYPNYVVGGPHSANGFLPKKWKRIFDHIPTFENSDGRPLHTLTTPQAYLTGYFSDPFSVRGATFAYYCVNNPDDPEKSGWIVWSPGPDGRYDLDYEAVKKYYDSKIPQPSREMLVLFAYDPTNGVFSRGDIYRVKQ